MATAIIGKPAWWEEEEEEECIGEPKIEAEVGGGLIGWFFMCDIDSKYFSLTRSMI